MAGPSSPTPVATARRRPTIHAIVNPPSPILQSPLGSSGSSSPPPTTVALMTPGQPFPQPAPVGKVTPNKRMGNDNAEARQSGPPSSRFPGRLNMYTSRRRSSVPTLGPLDGNKGTKNPPHIVYNNSSTGGTTSFPLVRQVTTIGRKEDNSIVLVCAKISKYHAEIKREISGSWTITDKNSSNGVKVNDERIMGNKPHHLADGDSIQIGSVTLTFYEDHTKCASPAGITEHCQLVTILPSEKKYEESFSIRAELQAGKGHDDFLPVDEVTSEEALRADYENLRMAYQISKLALTSDLGEVLAKTVDLMFSVLPVIDRCVVLLVDRNTHLLTTNMVRLREGKGYEGKEILMSSTILQRVYQTRTCLITCDACEDPQLGMAQSITKGQIRSVISVPLMAHDKVLGIIHLDSKAKIGAFKEKDLALVKTICNQTAIFIENAMLFKDSEAEVKAREQLSRFLPPQVVQKMTQAQEGIHKGGREIVGTVIFADIRGFTNMSERSLPGDVLDLLNDFFERLVKIVFKYNGVVDKYIGDALMGVFGTLDEECDSEFKSVAAALEFKKAIAQMNEERARHGKEPISVGIGLNTGMLVSGFIGCPQRLEYTVIGDTVNTSARICDLAQADQVLISESTCMLVQNRIETRYVGQHHFKGKSRPVGVYEAIGIKNEGKYNQSTLPRPARSPQISG